MPRGGSWEDEMASQEGPGMAGTSKGERQGGVEGAYPAHVLLLDPWTPLHCDC